MFDPATFMNQTVNTPLDTNVWIPPEGDYRAMIDDFGPDDFRTFTSEKNSKDYTVFSPPFVLQAPELLAASGRDKITVYHKGMFIDVDAAGGLDTSKGKNVDLGRLREAVGQNNQTGWTFNNLKGAGPVMVHVIHESDKNDSDRKYARISRVVKIG